MIVSCRECQLAYDDADRMTFCPHDLIMPADDLARKKAALALLGKRIRFAHEGGPETRVKVVTHDGYVEVDGFTGEFSPSGFVEVR